MTLPDFFSSVLDTAVTEVAAKAVPVYTFAFYHDHDSGAVSVCVDTEENSNRSVASMNSYNMRYFVQAVATRNLKDALLWQANSGRSLSLGDFALVNVARTTLDQQTLDGTFYVAMVQSLMAVHKRVAALALNPERLIFTCSGENDEVAYLWSMPSDT